MDNKFNPRVTPWQIHESEFPGSAPNEEKIKFLLRYVALAPSGHNTQPWKFKVLPDGIQIHADFTRRLTIVDPDDRELIISIGAAIMTLRIAAARFGYDATVRYLVNKETTDLMAFVGLSPTDQTDPELKSLFPAIVKRRTNRTKYEPTPITETILSKLQKLTIGRTAGIRIVADRNLQASIAELVAYGDRIQFSDPAFRKEAGTWVRTNTTRQEDGIAADGFGITGLFAWLRPWVISSFDLGKSMAKTDYQNAQEAAALAILYGEDSTESLLEVGKMLARFVLTLTTLSLQYAFLNQPVELRPLRTRLQSTLQLDNLPQLMLRIGYAYPQERAMPRRRLENLLVES